MISEAAQMGVPKYFFSSSVCVYRDMQFGEAMIDESGAYPALPDNEYGWEKLYSERMLQAFSRKYGMTARIARFQNCYGPDSAWEGGREKAPAALSRKVAQVEDGGDVEIWGDGLAIRNFIYIDDLVRAVYMLMHSDLEGAVNIGTLENVTVRQLLQYTAEAAGKTVGFKPVDGPVGVANRNFAIDRISSIGWKPEYTLRDGMKKTYAWVREQLIKAGQEVK
jgi:nucleoside-diphosphate-sugar epimerase